MHSSSFIRVTAFCAALEPQLAMKPLESVAHHFLIGSALSLEIVCCLFVAGISVSFRSAGANSSHLGPDLVMLCHALPCTCLARRHVCSEDDHFVHASGRRKECLQVCRAQGYRMSQGNCCVLLGLRLFDSVVSDTERKSSIPQDPILESGRVCLTIGLFL